MSGRIIGYEAQLWPAEGRILWNIEVSFQMSHADGAGRVGDFSGDIAFYREPISHGSMPGPGQPRGRLAARWIGRESSRIVYGTRPCRFMLETEVSPHVLDRLERWRNGGVLYARVEGEFAVVPVGFTQANATTARVSEFENWVNNPSTVTWQDARTESLELSRDNWCSSILTVLRPPGRVVIDFALPTVGGDDDVSVAIRSELEAAQKALDADRPEETARLLFIVLEHAAKNTSSIERIYGTTGKNRINDAKKAVMSIANQERHGNDPSDSRRTDRALAQFLLVSVSGLCAVYLRD